MTEAEVQAPSRSSKMSSQTRTTATLFSEGRSPGQTQQRLPDNLRAQSYRSLIVVPCIITVLPHSQSIPSPLRKRGETVADLRSLAENHADSEHGKHLRLSYIAPSEEVVEDYKRKSLPLVPQSRPTSYVTNVNEWLAKTAEVCDGPTTKPSQAPSPKPTTEPAGLYCTNPTPALDSVPLLNSTEEQFDAYYVNPTPALDCCTEQEFSKAYCTNPTPALD